jgi:hypothetical protein
MFASLTDDFVLRCSGDDLGFRKLFASLTNDFVLWFPQSLDNVALPAWMKMLFNLIKQQDAANIRVVNQSFSVD